MGSDRRSTRIQMLAAEQAVRRGARVSVVDVCTAAVAALPVGGAGLSAMSRTTASHPLRSTDDIREQLEELQLTLGEGALRGRLHPWLGRPDAVFALPLQTTPDLFSVWGPDPLRATVDTLPTAIPAPGFAFRTAAAAPAAAAVRGARMGSPPPPCPRALSSAAAGLVGTPRLENAGRTEAGAAHCGDAAPAGPRYSDSGAGSLGGETCRYLTQSQCRLPCVEPRADGGEAEWGRSQAPPVHPGCRHAVLLGTRGSAVTELQTDASLRHLAEEPHVQDAFRRTGEGIRSRVPSVGVPRTPGEERAEHRADAPAAFGLQADATAVDTRSPGEPGGPGGEHGGTTPASAPSEGESVTTYRGGSLRRSIGWRKYALATGLVFALAMLTVTAVELIMGKPVAAVVKNEPGRGTSVGGGTAGTPDPADTRTPTPGASSGSAPQTGSSASPDASMAPDTSSTPSSGSSSGPSASASSESSAPSAPSAPSSNGAVSSSDATAD